MAWPGWSGSTPSGSPTRPGKPKEYQLQNKPGEAAVYKNQLSDFLR